MIEDADPSFAEAMASIHASAFAPGAGWSAASFATELRLPGHFALIDRRGAFLLARVVAPEAEILTLAVLPALRRRGLGRALLAAALARAVALGGRQILLEVSAVNEAAIGLYGSAGFRKVGVRSVYYGDGSDALVLAAELA
ncbi:MAG: GNAT family N-acetyltransferase [Acetobacteraceae bacterium]